MWFHFLLQNRRRRGRMGKNWYKLTHKRQCSITWICWRFWFKFSSSSFIWPTDRIAYIGALMHASLFRDHQYLHRLDNLGQRFCQFSLSLDDSIFFLLFFFYYILSLDNKQTARCSLTKSKFRNSCSFKTFAEYCDFYSS